MEGLTILFDYCKCISYYYKMIIRSSHINYDLAYGQIYCHDRVRDRV